MNVRARASRSIALLGLSLAFAIVVVGSPPAAGLAVGDYWKYAYYQLDPGVEWFGNVTERFIGAGAGQNLIAFQLSGGGILAGEANGTWSVFEQNNYRPTDGAYVSSNSTLETSYRRLGQSFNVITATAIVDNPPVDFGGSLQVGSVSTATTSETVTQTRTVNGVSGNPSTQTATISLTQRVVARIEVTVPAGLFNALRIRLSRSDLPGYVEYAFNETVGNNVMVSVIDEFGSVSATLSLKEYRYNRAAVGGGAPSGLLAVPLLAIGATAAAVAVIVWRDRRRPPAIPVAPQQFNAGLGAPRNPP